MPKQKEEEIRRTPIKTYPGKPNKKRKVLSAEERRKLAFPKTKRKKKKK